MIKFTEFIVEDKKEGGSKLDHINHLEDLPIHGGHDGVHIAADFLDSVHRKLLGHETATHVSHKFDGSPGIVFGHHPKDGNFFIGTKSALNKAPKVFTDKAEIDKHYRDKPDLAAHLKAGLEHLPKIMPKKGGIYQGDMMYHKGSVDKKGKKLSFQPNTIRYSVDKDSAHGKAISAAQMGVVVHTKYVGVGDILARHAKPLRPKDRLEFNAHPDVHNIDPHIKPDPSKYTPKDIQDYMNHKENARAAYARMKPEAIDAVQPHAEHLATHINASVRSNQEPSVEGYKGHLTGKFSKKMEGLKTEKGKQGVARQLSSHLQHVEDNKEHFKSVLEMHHHLGLAKNVLTKVMAQSSDFEHHVDGKKTHPEGAVAVDSRGNRTKFVNRKEFSKLNFNKD